MPKVPKSRQFISESDSDGETQAKGTRKTSKEIPVYSLDQAPKNLSHYFKVQINLRIYEKNINRQDIYNELLKIQPNIQFIVSQEISENEVTKHRSDKIFKIVCDTKNCSESKWYAKDMYTLIDNVLHTIVGQEQEINEKEAVPMDRSPEIVIFQIDKLSNSIIWATERDFDPIFTSGYSPLLRTYSENYKIEQWARKNINNDFDITNEFVIQHKHSVTQHYLEKYLENHKSKFKKGNKLLPCPIGPFNDWREEVRQWWNDWVDNGWKPKKKTNAYHKQGIKYRKIIFCYTSFIQKGR